MNARFFLSGCLVMFVLAQCVSSESNLVFVDVNLSVSQSGSVKVGESLEVVEAGLQEIGVLIPQHAEDFSVSALKYDLKYNLRDFDLDRDLLTVSSREALENHTPVFVSYGTQYLTSKDGSVWTLKFTTQATPRKTIVRLNLPRNTKILSLSPQTLLRSYDKDAVWLYPETEEFNFTLKYEYGGAVVETTVPTARNETTTVKVESGGGYAPVLAAAALLIALLLVILLLLQRRGRRGRKEEGVLPGGRDEARITPPSGKAVFMKESEGEAAEEGKEVLAAGIEVNMPSVVHEGVELKTAEEKALGGGLEVVKQESIGVKGAEESGDEDLSDESIPVPVAKPSGGIRKIKGEVLQFLDENERVIVDLLGKYDADITQAFIYKTTKIPKASLSDILKRLEKRNLIERVKEGRVNWIKLKEGVFE